MDRFAQPARFDADPYATDSTDQWIHWLRTFKHFLSCIKSHEPNELEILINYLSPSVYKSISECETFEDAITTLNSIYAPTKSEIFARHMLHTCKQDSEQTLDQYVQKLRTLAADCNYQAVTADVRRDEAIRDALISGIQSTQIRQRLLEHQKLTLRETLDKAKALESAYKHSLSYHPPNHCNTVSPAQPGQDATESDEVQVLSAATNKCFFCGYNRHPRIVCPAREALCKLCGKKGHFQKVCRSKQIKKSQTAAMHSLLSSLTVASAPSCLERAVSRVSINGIQLQALIDTGSSESYVSTSVVKKHGWKTLGSKSKISMANTAFVSDTLGHCLVLLKIKDSTYHNFRLSVLPHLCADVLLGHDFLCLHERLEMPFGGSRPPVSLCNLTAAKVSEPKLFQNLSPMCKPITTRTRRHSIPDQLFIRGEVQKLLRDGIIEPSTSPWRAQVLVTSNERHKKRMVVDYSQTINRYTYLDAYPLPRIDTMIEKIAGYEVYSTLDLRSAYYQIPIRIEERKFTAFEADGNLYQFCRIPFGVTNGVACFQRTINELITKENLTDTFAYVDNVTICGNSIKEHDANLSRFREVARRYGLTFNEEKSIFRTKSVRLLGYEVSKGIIKPDPDRLQPLHDLPVPSSLKSQQRAVGLFSYYSHWISHFSDKIYPLVHNETFPLPEPVMKSFEALKSELENALLISIDYSQPLTVETDASDVALAATLNQNGRPVAFFSRTLSSAEQRHSSVEKEAYAVVEAIRKWRHYLIGNHFKLVTDQRSVAFMYDTNHKGRVKNDKVLRWRIELSPFQYDIVYRPGKDNQAADALSRTICGSVSDASELPNLHASLCHPGVRRMFHFVRLKNLPYSLNEVRAMTERCRACAQIKPRFHRQAPGMLIKATQPFERLNVDFKGPLPSTTRNKYLLTIIDEYSRFPFAFACPDMKASTIIQCFCELFSVFGVPAYIHSDQGPSFMSSELKDFLHGRNIATSRTTPYNPQGNGQVERLNGTLWKAISLGLLSRNLSNDHWEHLLVDALHSIRSLLCTATNATPHERMFLHDRRSACGQSIPSWLASPGPVLVKSFNRTSKYDPLIEEVELIECNPHYAHIRFKDGKDQTVSIRQLAPAGDANNVQSTQDHTQSLSADQSSPESAVELPGEATPSEQNLLDNAQNLVIQQQRTRPYVLRNREA